MTVLVAFVSFVLDCLEEWAKLRYHLPLLEFVEILLKLFFQHVNSILRHVADTIGMESQEQV